MRLKYNVDIPDIKKGAKHKEQVLEFFKSGNKTAEILGFTNALSEYNSMRSAVRKPNLPVQVILRKNRLFLKRGDKE